MPIKENEYFPETELTGPAWCIDGRADQSMEKGPQMPGGSAFPIIISLIVGGEEINEVNIIEKHNLLKEKGYITGAHRGSHKNPQANKSDCAFLDNLPLILCTTVDRQEEITDKLEDIYDEERSSFNFLEKSFTKVIDQSFTVLRNYPSEKVTINGDDIVSILEKSGALIENLEGDHKESMAYINTKDTVTFDTNKANKEGVQAFNLDLKPIIEQTNTLGVENDLATGLTLALYQTVDIILSEAKGKKPLQITIHK